MRNLRRDAVSTLAGSDPLALAKYFRSEAEQAGTGVLAERCIELVLNYDLACRNTAGAFLQETLKYGIVRYVADSENRRHRPFEPSPGMLAMLLHWLAIHLTTLDGLDGGRRLTTLQGRPELLVAMQPAIADGLLASRAVRKPDRTFSLLNWISDGGVLIDRLIAGCQHDTAPLVRIPTDLTSVSALSQNLKMSRTQPQIRRCRSQRKSRLDARARQIAPVGVGRFRAPIPCRAGREACHFRRRVRGRPSAGRAGHR